MLLNGPVIVKGQVGIGAMHTGYALAGERILDLHHPAKLPHDGGEQALTPHLLRGRVAKFPSKLKNILADLLLDRVLGFGVPKPRVLVVHIEPLLGRFPQDFIFGEILCGPERLVESDHHNLPFLGNLDLERLAVVLRQLLRLLAGGFGLPRLVGVVRPHDVVKGDLNRAGSTIGISVVNTRRMGSEYYGLPSVATPFPPSLVASLDLAKLRVLALDDDPEVPAP